MTSSDPEDPTSGEQPGSDPTPPTSRSYRAQLPADVDAAFAAIVADWASDGAPAWPAPTDEGTGDQTGDPAADSTSEGARPDGADGPSSGIGTATPPTGQPSVDGLRAGPPPDLPRPAGPRGPIHEGPIPDGGGPPPVPHRPHQHPGPDPADEHFVPPEPPPLPRLGPSSLVGIGLLVVGVVLLAVPSLLGASLALGIVPGLLAMTAGLGWLVLGMRRANESDDDDPDGGAVL